MERIKRITIEACSRVPFGYRNEGRGEEMKNPFFGE